MPFSSSFAARVAACSIVVAIAAPDPCRAQARFQRISVSNSGAEANGNLTGSKAHMSADGRYVAWDTFASNLSPWDINNTLDVFVRDRVAGTTILISAALTGLSGNSSSYLNAMSTDGRFVVFASSAYDMVKFDTNNQRDLFLRDRDPDANGILDEGNETTVRVNVDSAGNPSNGDSFGASVSDDGTKVAFRSDASNLVASDLNGTSDIFLRDLVAGTTTLVSVSTAGLQGNGYSMEPAITADGSLVFFASQANNLVAVDNNGSTDVFVRNLAAGTTGRVSLGATDNQGNADARDFSASSDGMTVVWHSSATNLVSGDTNGQDDVFLRDRTAGTTFRLSVSATGAQGDRGSSNASLSRNGDWVVYNSSASNLCGIETNNAGDVFVHDVAAGTLVKVSVHPSGQEGQSGNFAYSVSDDALTVAMMGNSFDLLGGDANGILDVVVRDRTQPEIYASWQNYGAGWPGTLGIPSFTPSADPVMGTSIDGLIGNSLGKYTVGFLYFGLQPISVPTRLGGTFLVDPIQSMVFLVPPAGAVISTDIPLDDAIVGISFFAQVLVMDEGASKGVSFTPGLELIAGQ
jgi:hypothetical protein